MHTASGNQALGIDRRSPPDAWICSNTLTEDLMARSSNAEEEEWPVAGPPVSDLLIHTGTRLLCVYSFFFFSFFYHRLRRHSQNTKGYRTGQSRCNWSLFSLIFKHVPKCVNSTQVADERNKENKVADSRAQFLAGILSQSTWEHVRPHSKGKLSEQINPFVTCLWERSLQCIT